MGCYLEIMIYINIVVDKGPKKTEQIKNNEDFEFQFERPGFCAVMRHFFRNSSSCPIFELSSR